MITRPKLSPSLLCLAMLGTTALAQTVAPGAPAEGTAPKQLHLDVVVTPNKSSGAPVAELTQSAFTVLDNGQPQPLTSFRAVIGNTEPVKMYLVIDDININFTRLAYERQQVDGFLKAHEGQLGQPTAVAVVTDTATEATPGFTTDGNLLAQTLDSKTIGLRDIHRSAGFYGAEDRLDLSVRALQRLISTAAAVPGRKAIVWISPGWPFLSGPNVQLTGKQTDSLFQQVMALSTQMRQANVTLYSVDPLGAGEGPGRTFYYQEFLKGVRKPSQVQIGDLGLQVLAEQSGGLALNSSNDVTSLLDRCAQDLKAFYEISYTPPPSDAPNEYHEVQVKVAEPHLVARTRAGYYAQP